MEEQVEEERSGRARGSQPQPTASTVPTAPPSSTTNAPFSTYSDYLDGQRTSQGSYDYLNGNYIDSVGWLRDEQHGIGGANPLNPSTATWAASSSPSTSLSWHTSFPPATTLAHSDSLLSSATPDSSLYSYAANAPVPYPNSLPLSTHRASEGLPPDSALSNFAGNGDGNSFSLRHVDNHWAGEVSAEDKERTLNPPVISTQRHTRPGDVGRSAFPAGAPAHQHPSDLPAKDGQAPLPPLTTANVKSPVPSLPAASAVAATNSNPSASGTVGATDGSNARVGISSGSPTTAPASIVERQQPLITKPGEGSGALGSSKPVVKMKRTGQSFPLASPASLHQRNSSYSPSRKLGLNPSTAAGRKSNDPVPSKAAGSPLTGRQPNAQAPKPGVEKAVERNSGVGTSSKPHGTTTTGARPAPRFPGAGGPTGLLPKATNVPKAEGSGSTKTFSTSNNESDDEIMYETAAGPQDLLAEGPFANDSSSGDSDSESEDDEAVEMDLAGETSFQQRFRAPDQESDGYDEDDTDEDDATSVSSSEGSSIANEPSVALPSANIQQQEGYPATILTMANPSRSYSTWPDSGLLVKASPAIFPDGYNKSTELQGFPWICAVRSCRMTYKSPAGLSNHFRLSHKKARLNDNMDGTLSLVGSYTKKNSSGLYPPVVVSKRPLDLKEPPMASTTIVSKAQKRLEVGPTYSNPDENNTPMGDIDEGSVEILESSRPTAAVDPKRSEELWEYIRPYLKVHSSLPATSWARHIIHLPRMRDIKWNEDRILDWPFKDTHARDVAAIVVQVTGVEAPTPCDSCAQGKGPFLGCITISPEASAEVRASVLSCANCYYHCQQSHCSLCSDAVLRRDRRSRILEQPESYNIKRLSDAARRKPDVETKPVALEASSRPKLRLYEPSEINNIEMADSSRTYKVIKDKDGENILMHGALIPDQYDLDRTVPGYPWICPVRSCRLVFKRIANLGSHFSMKHRGCLFNDNRNGTLSLVGYYNKPLPGEKTAPGLIISQNPLDNTEPPMEQASLPGSAAFEKKTQPKMKSKIMLRRSVALPHHPGGNTNSSLTGDAKRLWDYMLGFLPTSPSSMVFDPQTIRLFSLPRRRIIHWRVNWHRRRLRDDKYEILGLLLYLVGEEYDRACTNCRRHKGPFPGCFILPKEADYELHQFVKSCANCHVMHAKQACSLKAGWEARAGDKSRPSPPVVNSTADSATNASKKRRLSNLDAEEDETLALRRRSERFVDGDDDDKTAPRRKIVTLSLHPKNGRSTLGSGGAILGRTTTTGGPSDETAPPALINEGQMQPDDLLEMEDWEIAPGRIRETGAARIDNIAFSKSYLETNQAVQVSADVYFEVKTIKSGNSLQLEAESTKARYCSLASGKLRIRVEGQPEFTIGPHGMFKIKPGLKASVQNRLYIDSVLHITSHKEY